jgi:hypothetical protein
MTALLPPGVKVHLALGYIDMRRSRRARHAGAGRAASGSVHGPPVRVPRPQAPGRSDDRQITLFKSVGTAVQDIALAAKIYENALALGLGEKLSDFPYIADKSPPRIRHC